jgi:hypothetical protein
MRLPDLRPKADSRVAASVKPDPPREEAPAQAASAVETAEVQLHSVPQPESQLPEHTTASSSAGAEPVVNVSAADEPASAQAAPAAIESAPAAAEHIEATPTANEAPPQVAVATSDVTNASPADSAHPVTPAAARRQRALERQRRQTVDPPRQKRSWWTTHVPIIAIGFVLALVLTIYAGRRNRVENEVDSQVAAGLPEIEIDTGDGHDSLLRDFPEPAALTVDKPGQALLPNDTPQPETKSPPLLSAKPKPVAADSHVPDDRPAGGTARTAAKPGSSGSEITNHFVDSPGGENTPAAAQLTADAAAEYPSTEPVVYRPGGRVPREARVPNYPETSTPHLR